MKTFYKKLFAATLSSVCASVVSADSVTNDSSGIHAQARLGYIQTDDNTAKIQTMAIGGRIGVITPELHGLSGAMTLFTTNPLNHNQRDPFFLSSNSTGYSLVGEAYLQFSFGENRIRIGRQGIETPFADIDDIGMIQNNFEAIVYEGQVIDEVSLFVGYLNRWAGVDAPVAESFTKLDNNHGVAVYGMTYEIPEVTASLWYYDSNGGTDIFYAEAGFSLWENLDAGLQYAHQNDTSISGANSEGEVWGAVLSYAIGDFTLMTDHNKVSGGKGITNGFGGGPFYTSGIDHTIAATPNLSSSHAYGISYSGFPGWEFGLRKINFDKTENVTDFDVSWVIHEQFRFSLEYTDMNNDGDIAKMFMNYDF